MTFVKYADYTQMSYEKSGHTRHTVKRGTSFRITTDTLLPLTKAIEHLDAILLYAGMTCILHTSSNRL